MVSATSVALVGNSVAEGRLGTGRRLANGHNVYRASNRPIARGVSQSNASDGGFCSASICQPLHWRFLLHRGVPKIERHGDSEMRLQVLRVLWPTVIWMSRVITFMIALNARTGRVLGAEWAVICAFSYLRVDQRTSQSGAMSKFCEYLDMTRGFRTIRGWASGRSPGPTTSSVSLQAVKAGDGVGAKDGAGIQRGLAASGREAAITPNKRSK
jgi:hypothetical protein